MNLDEELGFYVIEGLERKQSIPAENNLRRMISQQVCCEIANLQFDVKIALMILESYDDEEFTENSQARIINEVIELLLDRSPQVSVTSPRSHLRSNLSIKESLINQECAICYGLMAEDESYRLDCDHVFCMDCLKEYLVQRIMNGHSDNMVCPQEDCDEMIPDLMIQKIIDEQLYIKMNKFRQLKKLAHDQSLRQCPRPDCDEFLHITDEQCKCGQLICSKCGQVEHTGLSCYEQSDKEFQKAVKKLKIFKCKKCKAPIQKNDGCNHMTCYQCGYEFCWLCRSRYSGKHYDAYYIFGCPGMQFAQRDPFRYPNFYRFLIILALIVLGPPIAVLAIGLGFVGLVLGLPVIAYLNCVSTERFNSMETCSKVIHVILIIIACFVLSPLSLCLVCLGLVAGVIIGIPYGIYVLIDYLRN